jgi:DNA-directed RNA polymerase specialized sigma24 family protein
MSARMTAIEGHAAAEVATELGMQLAAVRKAKSRIARRLREVIGDVDEES